MKKELGKIYLNLRNRYRKFVFEKIIKTKPNPLKIVIGSSGVYQKKWIPTEQSFLDLLNESNWSKYFAYSSIDVLLAEHVWEHLTPEQGKKACEVCFKFLKSGGHLRLAVPDGLHSDKSYIDVVKPGGTGWGADDHKILYTYQTMSDMLTNVGFKVELLEYFDETGKFIATDWNTEDGFVRRSKRFDERNKNGKLGYTSLIIDAIKP